MGEGEGGRRLRLRPRGASAPEGEPLARRGVDESDLVHNWSPLPFIPSRGGEGRFYGTSQKKLEINYQTFLGSI